MQPRVLYLSGWPIGAHGEGPVSFVYEQIQVLSHDVQACYIQHHFDAAFSWARRKAWRRDVEVLEGLWDPPTMALRVWTPRWPTRLTKRSLLDDVREAGAMVARRISRTFGRVDLVHAHVVLPAGLLAAGI